MKHVQVKGLRLVENVIVSLPGMLKHGILRDCVTSDASKSKVFNVKQSSSSICFSSPVRIKKSYITLNFNDSKNDTNTSMKLNNFLPSILSGLKALLFQEHCQQSTSTKPQQHFLLLCLKQIM